MIHDVVIAGAGPVGLFLACELRLRGIAVLVLERLEDPHTPLKSKTGFGLLVDFHGNPALEALTRGREDRLRYVPAKAKDNLGLAALLIRPDGFVAWAADSEPDLTEAAAVIEQWFA